MTNTLVQGTRTEFLSERTEEITFIILFPLSSQATPWYAWQWCMVAADSWAGT